MGKLIQEIEKVCGDLIVDKLCKILYNNCVIGILRHKIVSEGGKVCLVLAKRNKTTVTM